MDDTQSEETLYHKAVEQKRTSSSSEEGLDISDESNVLNNLILDNRESKRSERPQAEDAGTSQQLPDNMAELEVDPDKIADTMV